MVVAPVTPRVPPTVVSPVTANEPPTEELLVIGKLPFASKKTAFSAG